MQVQLNKWLVTAYKAGVF